ncbi:MULTISPECIES: tyrosine-type recombinase/integrase [unclassified Marinobacter]|uniref:phage integrase n=1 Tax=unclassified Marinobacter TaxID=83889 RepID=UPI00200CB8D7|nr:MULTISPECIES: tyrosine-type recombinase/integrase [unclassified Marinobacter]MCL1487300.1 tyrosine-type recombinase/integrase [Marinobacter sp.]UQG55511.1 tyrosine-type recombinase/integrase [Marinobacter sp. M4C]UQG64315.1 tyrosine-type recombinase/integrase [Marinobacter sp. M2C]UQG68594.1 tyrosine-type recombinase/integrase [Marinobacter sp. M1C]
MIKKLSTGRWQVDIQPGGRGSRRIRKSFDTKLEARRFESLVLAHNAQGNDWNPSARDKRTISQLVNLWYDAKGVHLKDGYRRKRSLLAIASILNDPAACSLKPGHFLQYRALKVSAGIAPKTLNNHLGYLNAVYNELYRLREISYSNPIESVSSVRVDEIELSWLTSDQIQHLLHTIANFTVNPHVLLLTRLCLSTGARWGEAERLTVRHLRNSSVTFVNTKSGKTRTVPLSPGLFQDLTDHLTSCVHFSGSLSAFRRCLDQSGIQLPKGQCSHVLRHTFASHFAMNGGHLLTLQKILGHSTINMTMRYAHLSPDHLVDAVRLNPFSDVDTPLTHP